MREFNSFEDATEALKNEEEVLLNREQDTHKQWDIEILALSSVSAGFLISSAMGLVGTIVLPTLFFVAISFFGLSIITTLIGFSLAAENLRRLIELNGQNLEHLLVLNRCTPAEAPVKKKEFEAVHVPLKAKCAQRGRHIDLANKVRMLAFIAGLLCGFCFLCLNVVVAWSGKAAF